MANIALNVFKGMWPRSSRQQLPAGGSELAVNCDMLSGDLRSFRGLVQRAVLTSPNPIKAAFRIPASFRDNVVDPPPASVYSPDDVWFFTECYCTHFVKGPLVNDAYDRFYWTQKNPVPTRPHYAALDDIVAGGTNGGASPYYILGVPNPNDPVGNEFTITPSGGTPSLVETRCYVYTYTNTYGEESGPSIAVCAEGNADGTWDLANLKTVFDAPWDTEGNPLKSIKIYRTITGETGSSYFFVDEIISGTDFFPPTPAVYNDTKPTDEVSLNAQLESAFWQPPPENLIGIIRHPDGFLVGFENGGDLRFSVPYRPHAWPAAFSRTTEGDIQALGIFGQSVVVTTNAHPYVATGVTPESMTLVKSDTSAPCMAQESLVSFERGVVYASPDGLSFISSAGLQLLTENIITAAQWKDRYAPSYIHAARDGLRYIGVAVYQDKTLFRRGMSFAPKDASSMWTEVRFDRQQEFETLQTDIYSGDIYTVIGDRVYSVNDPYALPTDYQWKSNEYVTARPVNFGAYRIDFDTNVNYPGQAPNVTDYQLYKDFNDARIQHPIDPIGYHALGMVRQVTLTPPSTLPQWKQPLGGSPLYKLYLIGTSYITVQVYGDRELRYSKRLTNPGRYKLPDGYKTDLWQIEFSGTADLHHFKIAETGKELASV